MSDTTESSKPRYRTKRSGLWIVYSRTKRIEAFGHEGLLPQSRYAIDLAGLFD